MSDETEIEEVHEKTITAGKILRTVKEEVRSLIKPGVKLIDIAEFVENKIRELGGEPAFPCNISLNSDAAHFTPKRGDKRVLNDGDVVKLDIGAHIDGIIADTAITFDLGDHRDMVIAVEKALESAIGEVYAGADTSDIGKAIEREIREMGYKPVVNLTGHGLMPYLAHSPPTIFNYGTDRGVRLEEGMVIAIEPFATDGAGKVGERGETEIYSVVSLKPVRMKMAREILKEVEKYKTLPFAKRWLKKAPDIIMNKLVREGILRSYPVLAEVERGIVTQAEHTVIVESDGARIVT